MAARSLRSMPMLMIGAARLPPDSGATRSPPLAGTVPLAAAGAAATAERLLLFLLGLEDLAMSVFLGCCREREGSRCRI